MNHDAKNESSSSQLLPDCEKPIKKRYPKAAKVVQAVEQVFSWFRFWQERHKKWKWRTRSLKKRKHPYTIYLGFILSHIFVSTLHMFVCTHILIMLQMMRVGACNTAFFCFYRAVLWELGLDKINYAQHNFGIIGYRLENNGIISNIYIVGTIKHQELCQHDRLNFVNMPALWGLVYCWLDIIQSF